MPKKKRIELIRHLVRPATGHHTGNQVRYKCSHCSNIFRWVTFNSTKAASHLLRCRKLPSDLKESVLESSQVAKRNSMLATLSPTAADGSIAAETSASLVGAAAASMAGQRNNTGTYIWWCAEGRQQQAVQNAVSTPGIVQLKDEALNDM
jgi:membrane-bound inhibitor of C-type lysozyme